MNASEYSHHTTGSSVEAISDHVIVDYIESTGEKTVNGIIIPGEDSTDRGIKPRWARVASVGPQQTAVSPGEWVLVKHGEWTRGTLINDKVYRRVNPNEIYLACNEMPDGIVF